MFENGCTRDSDAPGHGKSLPSATEQGGGPQNTKKQRKWKSDVIRGLGEGEASECDGKTPGLLALTGTKLWRVQGVGGGCVRT